jgi:hypothetical protein
MRAPTEDSLSRRLGLLILVRTPIILHESSFGNAQIGRLTCNAKIPEQYMFGCPLSQQLWIPQSFGELPREMSQNPFALGFDSAQDDKKNVCSKKKKK